MVFRLGLMMRKRKRKKEIGLLSRFVFFTRKSFVFFTPASSPSPQKTLLVVHLSTLILRAKVVKSNRIRLPIDCVPSSFILFYFSLWVIVGKVSWFSPFFFFWNRVLLRVRFFLLFSLSWSPWSTAIFFFLLYPPIFQFSRKEFLGVCVCVGMSSTREGRRRRDDTQKLTAVVKTFFEIFILFF